jgi:hypothetical protein
MHYGKPKSIEDQYYNDPWLSKDGKYGLKRVSRDEVVKLYKKAEENDGNYTFGKGNSLYACDIGVGNCTDYHSYFLSLTRTLNIPSRFHMGFLVPQNGADAIEGYHCWADYFVQNKGWYPVDISEADKNPEKSNYFFGNLDPNRIEFVIGRDIILDNFDNGLINLFIYPILEIDDKISNKYRKMFTYKNL